MVNMTYYKWLNKRIFLIKLSNESPNSNKLIYDVTNIQLAFSTNATVHEIVGGYIWCFSLISMAHDHIKFSFVCSSHFPVLLSSMLILS